MALSSDFYVVLKDGYKMPVIGFGTDAPNAYTKEQAMEGTKSAIEVGYRHIDSAKVYRNEVQVGQAIRAKIADGTVKREDVFYTAKAMEACRDAGLVRSIRVSNFNQRQLELILNMPGLKYKPVCNQCPKEQAMEGTKSAIDVGYRHIDSAAMYGNEVQVGQAIRAKIADGTVKREDIFYTGKLWNNNHVSERVRIGLEKSLKDLQLDYLDLFIIHTPVAFKPGDDLFPMGENGKLIFHNTDIRDTWKAMEACRDAGLVRSIGVSNFTRKQLELILNMPGLKHKPVCNQVECHMFNNQSKLLEFCKSQDIVVVGYSVLGSSRDKASYDQDSPRVLEDPVLNTVANKLHRSPAQVSMRYFLQRGVVVLAKSFNPERIKQNFQIFDFVISDEDMKTLDGIHNNMRYLTLDSWKEHPNYPFHDEY